MPKFMFQKKQLPDSLMPILVPAIFFLATVFFMALTWRFFPRILDKQISKIHFGQSIVVTLTFAFAFLLGTRVLRIVELVYEFARYLRKVKEDPFYWCPKPIEGLFAMPTCCLGWLASILISLSGGGFFTMLLWNYFLARAMAVLPPINLAEGIIVNIAFLLACLEGSLTIILFAILEELISGHERQPPE